VRETGRVSLEVRRASGRFVTSTDGIVSRHSFSFGAHYDPTNVGHALLVAHNDDVVAPGAGYDTHPHRDLEIVTWVLDGGLRHEDSHGHGGLVVPGLVQRLSAGDGVLHSERNDAATGASVRFVQMWLRPDEPGGDPSYAQHDAGPDLATGELVPLAGHGTAVPLRAAGAVFHAARPRPGGTVALPDAPAVHLFVARGSGEVDGAGRLDEGDAVRLQDGGPRGVVAGRDGCELLVWSMRSTP
jgi:redox-sensitive bicupin YhaK (pirin superfamily)